MNYRSILLVEDDPDAEALTLLALAKNKIHNQTSVARDGAEALEHLFGHADASQELPALILLDLNLPKLDGFEVLRLIRADERTRLIPVVILTSSAQEEDILAGYQAGANAYVRKPVNFADFIRAIGALCTFWLLVCEPPPDAVSPAAGGAPPAKRDLVHPAMAEADPARPGALRVLILDDNPTDAELARRFLSRSDHDFAIAVADDRTSYAHQLAAFRPNVILVDYSLPGMSGESALAIAREHCPDTPVIVLSGEIGDEAAAGLIRQGATDFILKDRPARLVPVVHRAVAEAEQRSQLARLQAHLERAQRMESIGRLAAGVAHEFNNQVGVMLSSAAFIGGEAADKARQGTRDEGWDAIRRDAEQIEQAGQRVIKLVHLLLTAGGSEIIRAEVIDLNEIVGGIYELLQRTAGDGIELQMSLAPRLLPVSADPGQIAQVLLNLTMNAGEAMPDGGSLAVETQNVTISPSEAAELGLRPGAYVCLSTRDTGVGMEPEVLEHVFEPFFTTKPFVEGGGLGLASSYGIIRQSGGTVRISSVPGSGTAVTLWLPAAASETTASPAQLAEAPREPEEKTIMTDDPQDARESQEQSEVAASTARRDVREARERREISAGTDARDAREAQERSEVSADADRRATREAQERKDRSLVQAQRLESLGQLAGGVAHDFNNLLSVILNYASFASEDVAAAAGPDPGPQLEAAGADLMQIRKAAERATGLTHQLLLFARRDVIRPQVLDINSIITSVEEMLRRTLGEHIELAVTLAGDLWPVLADPGQLEQVLVNLAVNARDAMPGGGTLTIDTSNITVDADAIAGGSKARLGRNVRLRVSDTGVGMTPKTAERVFQPFFTTRRDDGGTGLGLATVYGIVLQADGHIRIYSEPGVGTTFTIILPVTAEAATPLAEPAPYQRMPKGETVLVVEDEAALREVTKRILARNGYQVITAASGPEALAIATAYAGEIHLLVTDVVMPHMLGKEVAEKMRGVKPGIEVLFMSGYARPVLASQGRLDPNVALVEKPFSEDDLVAMAGQVLNGHFQGFTNSRSVPGQQKRGSHD